MRGSIVVALAGLAACQVCVADNRTIDGQGNNPFNDLMGCNGSNLIRGSTGPHFSDGLGAPIDRGGARAISNAVSAQTVAGLGNSRNLSSWAWQWGQFIDHDFALVDEGTTEPFNIPVPIGDPTFDPGHTGTKVIPFTRSVFNGGVSTPRQHSNSLTHWLDGSMVYGSNSTRASALRAPGGLLATSAGSFMPYNTGGLPNAGSTSPAFFLGGDIRANEQTGLLAVHTLFVREHNRLAGQIAAANPGWGDDQVYEKARKLVGAEVQAITYNEWLPALLGGHGPGSYAGYNPNIDASINTEFSTAAFRIGHTMLNDQLLRVNADGSTFSGGHLNLFQAFFNPSTITEPGSMDAVIRGLARQQSNEIDTQAIDGVRNLLFGGTDGRDLIAVNLQRGRDHGLPDYNTLRQEYGLPAIATFSDITANPELALALESAYGVVNNIDAWIGLFSEDHLPGASVGETCAAIFADQFMRLREGDRYFYLNDGDLSAQDLAFLEGVRLADIIRWNSGAVDVQGGVFFAVPAPGVFGVMGLGAAAAVRRRRR